MTTELFLLGLIAVCCVIITIALLVGLVVLLRVIGRYGRMVETTLSRAEQEVAETMREVRGTARGVTELSGAGKRLAEELVIGYASRRLSREPGGEPAGNQALLAARTGLDIAFRLAELWRNVRTTRRRTD